MRSQSDESINENIASPAIQFDEIAFLYDELMNGVPYRNWVDYLTKILKKFDYSPDTILDLCCGTGNVSTVLASAGYSVTGVDISPGMIDFARQKVRKDGIPIDFHVQDASSLNLGRRKFDLVISLFDSLNYILETPDLQQVFYKVGEHLNEGGYFIFDMNTEVALAIGLFNQSNPCSRSPVKYHWRSSYNTAARICRIQMDFLYKKAGEEKRVEIMHYQRAYDEEEIIEMLALAGLQAQATFDAYTFKKATKKSDRIFFVAGK